MQRIDWTLAGGRLGRLLDRLDARLERILADIDTPRRPIPERRTPTD